MSDDLTSRGPSDGARVTEDRVWYPNDLQH